MSKNTILAFYALCLIVANALVPDVDYDDPRAAEIIREAPFKLNLCRHRPELPFCRELRNELNLSEKDLAKPRQKRVVLLWVAYCGAMYGPNKICPRWLAGTG